MCLINVPFETVYEFFCSWKITHGAEWIDVASDRVNDDIFFQVQAGQTLCVNLYFADFTLMQSAVLITGPLSKRFFSLGDQTSAGRLPLDTSKTTNWFYFLSNIDILTSPDLKENVITYDALVCGDRHGRISGKSNLCCCRFLHGTGKIYFSCNVIAIKITVCDGDSCFRDGNRFTAAVIIKGKS